MNHAPIGVVLAHSLEFPRQPRGAQVRAGMAIAAKALKPAIRIAGVQSECLPGMLRALGRIAAGPAGPSIAEGIAVASAGALTARLAGELVDEIVTVSEAGIEDAVAALLEIEKSRLLIEVELQGPLVGTATIEQMLASGMAVSRS